MAILGTALLAACYLLGTFIGDLLGAAIGVKANVGGVGIAMMLLIASISYLRRFQMLNPHTERGVTFWAMMYIPVVVAMAATQNVLVAFRSGTVALLAAVLTVASCFCAIAIINSTIHRRNGGAVWQGDNVADTQ
jgi:malonate transporter MadL subunit